MPTSNIYIYRIVESDHMDNRSAINSPEGGLLNEKCRYCEMVYWRAPVQ